MDVNTRRLWMIVVAVSLSASFAGAAPIENSVPAEPEEVFSEFVKTPRKRAVLPTREDDLRTQLVLNNLVQESGWFAGLEIRVNLGMVTISGHTDNADQLNWLAETADRIPSVIAVINQTTVDPSSIADFAPIKKEFRRLVESGKKALPLLLMALLLSAFFFYSGRTIKHGVGKVWARKVQNPFLLTTVTRLTMLPLWTLFFYLILQVAGLSTLATTIIGGTGVIGIVLGFAFKDIAENYISGLILSVGSPFTKGDEVVIDQHAGYIQSLSMRGTTIFDYSGTMVLIPNRIVLQSVIQNISANPKSRISFDINIAIADPIPRAQVVIYQVLKEMTTVLGEPAPSVIAVEVTRNSITLRVLFWFHSRDSKMQVTSSAIAATVTALRASGFQIMTETLVLESRSESEQRASKALHANPTLPKCEERAGHERDAIRINKTTKNEFSLSLAEEENGTTRAENLPESNV